MMSRSGMGRVLTAVHWVCFHRCFHVVVGPYQFWQTAVAVWIFVSLIFLSLFSSAELNNGLKKEVSSKDVARIWVNDDMKMRSFSPVNVSLIIYFYLLMCDEAFIEELNCKFNVIGFFFVFIYLNVEITRNEGGRWTRGRGRRGAGSCRDVRRIHANETYVWSWSVCLISRLYTVSNFLALIQSFDAHFPFM